MENQVEQKWRIKSISAVKWLYKVLHTKNCHLQQWIKIWYECWIKIDNLNNIFSLFLPAFYSIISINHFFALFYSHRKVCSYIKDSTICSSLCYFTFYRTRLKVNSVLDREPMHACLLFLIISIFSNLAYQLYIYPNLFKFIKLSLPLKLCNS